MSHTLLKDLEFSDEDKAFLSSLINRFGNAQYPYCDEKTFGYFTVHYIKKLCGYKKVAKELSEKGLTKLKVIQDILDNGNS